MFCEGTVSIFVFPSVRDERVWPDPDSFDPTRFLDESGRVDRQMKEQLLSFSVGTSAHGQIYTTARAMVPGWDHWDCYGT